MMPKLLSVVAAASLLSGCLTLTVHDEGSSASRISVGSRITLHQSITIPAGHARVFMQGGKVMGKVELNQYLPHCNFEVRELSDGNSRISPDSFLVIALQVGSDRVVSNGMPIRLAVDMDMYRFHSPSPVSRYIKHRLQSTSQPGVMNLTCHGGFDEPALAEYPGIRAIREALGGLATLEKKL